MSPLSCALVVGIVPLQVLPLEYQSTLYEGLDNPARLWITSTAVFVTDTRANAVLRFDLAGNLLNRWNEPAGPVGVAVHPDGRIFVSRRDDARVGIYDPNFALLSFLADGLMTFAEPTDLAVDSDGGRIYVVDSGADRFYAFNSSGSLVFMVGNRGSGFQQFKYPSAIALDAVNQRILVADQDNFRVQVFSSTGLFLFSFGYRIKYLPTGGNEGWFPRGAGLAVDGAGRIYVVDALMSTLRVFTPQGAELGKVVGFGSASGELQAPADVALDASGRVYVANSNVGGVEVYNPPSAVIASESGIFWEGTNDCPYDRLGGMPNAECRISNGECKIANGELLPDPLRSSPFALRHSVVAAVLPGWEPPHMHDDVTCGRCHSVDGQPGGHLGTLAGQTYLCISCHTSGGHALTSALRTADRVSFGSPPPDSGGRSHAWGVPAVNSAAGSVGPPAGSEMAHYLSGGTIKCATCHNQHNNEAGKPYLRVNNASGGLCLSCHAGYVAHTPAGSWQPTCSECHGMHEPRSGNISLIAAQIRNRTLGVDKPVILTSQTGPHSFDDGDPSANDGLCQVCHTQTSYHRQDGTGAGHHNGQNCISCHPHGNGFLPTGGGDCTSCHAVAQDNGDGVPAGGRRAVVGEFPLGDAHAHYGSTLDNNACLVCHDQSTHMDGYVDLIDPDDGGIYRFRRPGDLVSDPDLSDFCAACHDSDGAARLTSPLDPFGAGNAPPNVAAKFSGTLQWEEKYGDFCFGTEGMLRPVNSHHDISDADQAFSGAKIECLNCHGAHSAGRSQPVVDPFAPASPWTSTTTAFCIACHNGGTGPLDPGFPPGVVGPVIDTTDSRWATAGFSWNNVLGGACVSGGCSSLRGIDSCDYVERPWYVDYSWTHSVHGAESKRAWNGYSGAPGATIDCTVCHDPHGSWTPTNPAGNPYLIRDVVDGTPFVDDGTRSGGFNSPPWTTFGVSRSVTVPVSGTNVGWGAAEGLCGVCHAQWAAAYNWHDFCTSCQTCHGHGMAWGEADWVDFNSDTPCPVTAGAASTGGESASVGGAQPSRVKPDGHALPLHQLAPRDAAKSLQKRQPLR